MNPGSSASDEASKQLHGELRQVSDTPCTGMADQPTQQTVVFGISPAYVKDWDTTDAFRELYQNWYVSSRPLGALLTPSRRDAILVTFQLDRRDLKLSFHDDNVHFAIIASSAPNDHADLLARGFIKYEKNTGRVTLANACAQLPIESLVMGHTTRDRDNRLSGSHGDGLKLAALVMTRQQFQMSIVASHCNWKFGLHAPQQSLRCVITAARKVSRSDCPAAADDMANLRSRKNAMAGRLDVFYHAADQTLRVPHQWWKLDSVDHGGPCHNVVPMASGGQYAPISWQEVVEELLILSIPSVFTAFPMSRITENRYMRHIRRLLRRIPQDIQISPHASGLLVTWEDHAADTVQDYEGEPEYKAILHAGYCGADAELLHSETGRSVPPIMCCQTELSSETPTATSFAACGCRQQLVSRSTQWCVFAEVDQFTAYYAMICVNEQLAIYGLPSEMLIPGTSVHDNSLVSCDPTVLASVGIKHEGPIVVPTSPVPAHLSDMSYPESCKRLKVSHLLKEIDS